MNRYYFDEDVNKESVQKVTDYFKELSDKDSVGTFYICSDGGNAHYEDILIEILNEHPKWIVEVSHNAWSSATELFLFCKNRKRLGRYFSYIVAHRANISCNMSGVKNMKPLTSSGANSIMYDRVNKKLDKKYSRVLTKKEMKSFKNHDDVVLISKRVKKIIKKLNKKNGHK